ncbi:hypothetical protein [Maridesulfovibrio salexigens]|uniref:Uncharacterized protein n=1 Tax=Maridesulfovibrio salexigens (strain ATCC 14822 / DSM 2638 / NCIMB 8403 / VKM B-1763) TaxID=526222 RepID=C6BXE1_MARSD|nr:hypothetical protein [Maridesulfovibrio salexigens]ACS80447.1 hypothetical protein Desal_2391 [Maridesulfovibrio salexigens DSM 2638]
MRVFCCLIALVFCFGSSAPASSLEDVWGEVHPLLSDAVSELDLRSNVPDSSWNPLKDDKGSVDNKINDLLDECIEILGISGMSESKSAIRKLQEDSRYCREQVAELKTERLAAPKKVKKWEVWKKDADSIEAEIRDLEIREEENDKRIEGLIDQLLTEMQGIGMKVDREQVETLVYSVTGDDDVRLVSVFNNVKLITTELQRLTAEANENIEMAKRYYGMHTLLLRILLNLYDNYEQKIENVYLVRIAEIVKKQEELIQRTVEKINSEPVKYRAIYKTNLAAQGLTVRTAKMYDDYLRRNKIRVADAKSGISHEYEVALNTFETVQGAHSLITLMQDANAMLERISELQTPDLVVFQNIEMKNEFRKLTNRINSLK